MRLIIQCDTSDALWDLISNESDRIWLVCSMLQLNGPHARMHYLTVDIFNLTSELREDIIKQSNCLQSVRGNPVRKEKTLSRAKNFWTMKIAVILCFVILILSADVGKLSIFVMKKFASLISDSAAVSMNFNYFSKFPCKRHLSWGLAGNLFYPCSVSFLVTGTFYFMFLWCWCCKVVNSGPAKPVIILLWN